MTLSPGPLVLFIFFSFSVYGQAVLGYSFSQALESLASHESIEAIKSSSRRLKEEGRSKSSWGDPRLKIAAKNFPKDSLKDDETPMTGIELGLMQKIPLTNKYGHINKAYQEMGKAKEYESQYQSRTLIRNFWNLLILEQKREEELQIFKENLEWMNKTHKVSKRLYANGKISQQAILDIQIRKSEIEAALSNKKFEIEELRDEMSYLIILKGSLDKSSIPWELLTVDSDNPLDDKELAFQSKLKAKTSLLNSERLAFVPDVTASIGYTKRSNIDKRGDFVSASLTFPLPFSGQKYANKTAATYARASAKKKLENYQRMKESQRRKLEHQIEKIISEIDILKNRTIKFSENSRAITAKSYALGRSSYVELLQSELKLQKLLLKKSNLKAKLSQSRVGLKYLLGEKLYE
jgi:outer membrane protein TolC